MCVCRAGHAREVSLLRGKVSQLQTEMDVLKRQLTTERFERWAEWLYVPSLSVTYLNNPNVCLRVIEKAESYYLSLMPCLSTSVRGLCRRCAGKVCLSPHCGAPPPWADLWVPVRPPRNGPSCELQSALPTGHQRSELHSQYYVRACTDTSHHFLLLYPFCNHCDPLASIKQTL